MKKTFGILMKKNVVAFMVLAAAFLPALALAGNDTVLEFRTMVGVSGPFLGADNPIRNVNGGGLPWVLDSAKGELETDGELDIKVRGLIIPESAGFGFNPVPFFRATVSCITISEFDEVVVENVSTDNGPEVMKGDPENGDARIRATIGLPNPCIAPIVFVTSPTGSWFSVTGVEEVADMETATKRNNKR